MKVILKSFLVVATALFVAGCGGGGNIGAVEEDTLFPSDSRLAYANNENAKEVGELLFGYNTNSLVPANARKIADSKKMTILNLVLDNVKEFKKNQSTLKNNRVTDESDYCDSGSLYKETLNDGTVEFRYDNCTHEGLKYDGIIQKHRYSNKLDINYVTDFIVKDLYDGTTIVVKKESSISLVELDSGDFKITLNLVTAQNGKSSGFENVVFIYNASEATMYQRAGNIYINNLQDYVAYDNSYRMKYTPLVYSDDGTIIDGEAHYIMRGATLIIRVDEDGIANYEILR